MRFYFTLFLLLVVSACTEHNTQAELPSCTIKIGAATWKMEIAKSEEDREKGLMFRKTMPEKNGMVFVFTTPHKVAMWMKDTYIPLDMIFVGENSLVNGIENASPLSENIIRSQEVVAYVLELNAGQVAKNDIKIGDKLDTSQCPSLSASAQ